jgi:hypothetical protein
MAHVRDMAHVSQMWTSGRIGARMDARFAIAWPPSTQLPGGDTAAVPSDRRGTGARRRDTARRPAPRMGSPGRGTE